MVDGVLIEGAAGLSKVLKGNRTIFFIRVIGGVPRHIVSFDQVIAFDLPFVDDVIHHDVAIFKVPTRRKLGVLLGEVNVNFLRKSCIIDWFVAVG